MKLKTLKDLEFYDRHGVDDSKYISSILKDEAVKWVKADRPNGDITWFIKHFFNLTEEDLK